MFMKSTSVTTKPTTTASPPTIRPLAAVVSRIRLESEALSDFVYDYTYEIEESAIADLGKVDEWTADALVKTRWREHLAEIRAGG
jgi:hypothetical protein